jgi:alanyl-tRNA synthetase
MDGFENAMEKQREKSRSVTAFTSVGDAFKELSARGYKPEFVGYDITMAESKVVLIAEEGHEVNEAREGKIVEVVTELTPFYGEAGGQLGDTGKITGANFELQVSDTIKDPTGLIIHKGKILSGKITKGDHVTLTVDKHDRNATALNHTATHILHAALKNILGDHVKQAGSMVGPDRLRFDFTHFSQVALETIEKIEDLVNDKVRENVTVGTIEMDAEEAFKTGATALFEEKYGDRVRVVSLSDFSKELCGGTHTGRTGNIGLFKITSEYSVASGVRRIEAVTGKAAVEFIQKNDNILQNLSKMVKDKPENLPQRIEKLLLSQKSLEKELERLKAKIAAISAGQAEDDIQMVKGIKVLAKRVSADKPSALRDLADKFRDKIQSGIVVLGSTEGSKVFLIAVVTKDLTNRYHAGEIIKKVAAHVGGGGGGRPDMAQAGGDKPENLDMALEKVPRII